MSMNVSMHVHLAGIQTDTRGRGSLSLTLSDSVHINPKNDQIPFAIGKLQPTASVEQ